MKTEVLDTLFGDRDQLSDMIIDLTPGDDPAQKAAFQKLVQRRDRLTGTINDLIACDFNAAAQGLNAKVAELDAQSAELQALDKKVQNISAAIQVTDQIVQLVMDIIKLVAA